MLISTTKILSVLHYDKNIKIPEKNAKKHEPLKNHQKDESLGGPLQPCVISQRVVCPFP